MVTVFVFQTISEFRTLEVKVTVDGVALVIVPELDLVVGKAAQTRIGIDKTINAINSRRQCLKTFDIVVILH